MRETTICACMCVNKWLVWLNQHQHSMCTVRSVFSCLRSFFEAKRYPSRSQRFSKHFVLIQLQTHHVRTIVCALNRIALCHFLSKIILKTRCICERRACLSNSVCIRLVFTRWLFGRAVGRVCLCFSFFIRVSFVLTLSPIAVCMYNTHTHLYCEWHNELKKSRDQFRNRRVK